MIRSYLRWTGSKSRILQDVIDAIGDSSDKRLIEPFVGSGSVALNVQANDYLLNDSNTSLINSHKQVQKDPHKVYDFLVPMYTDSYDKYYDLRTEFNTLHEYNVYKAALFIYLNGHNFNGMYRENKKGGYNVPIGSGNVKDPLQDMLNFNLPEKAFTSSDFEEVVDQAGSGDVLYCDPPYPSDSISDSEITYTKDGFSKEDHIRLRDTCLRAKSRGAKVVVSYCDIDFIRELYVDADEIIEIYARRSVSSKSNTRGKAKEIIIIFNGD